METLPLQPKPGRESFFDRAARHLERLRPTEANYLLEAGLLVSYQMADMLTTVAGFSRGNIERNWLIRPFLEANGILPTLAIKEAYFGLFVLGAMEIGRRLDERILPAEVWLLRATNVLFAAASVNNLINTLR